MRNLENMKLEQCVELDARTIQLTVHEMWSERRWLIHTRFTTVRKTYTLALRVGRWLDGETYVLRQDSRHERLFGIWSAWRIEQKLNRVVELPVARPLLDS